VIEGANIPITHAAESILYRKGIQYMPDFIANAGGVICAAMEYHGANESAALATIRDKLIRNTEQVLTRAKREGIEPREASMQLALERIHKAMSYRRFSSFSTASHFV
jgi:glutamate dehydrogenase (NAD(P)+)